jgi:hypothetical protein
MRFTVEQAGLDVAEGVTVAVVDEYTSWLEEVEEVATLSVRA